ncbi:hypothetical protein BU16DRAFT_533383 [Lophium mytilinum]|uniref:Uncharacterized protein n=1 Tax=Lophium mytilinum TaxID=390894 RepID=A0A6A6REV9_9PEZI|nr:hypothetical protein BU16DRAFT_533383 [Lophium mytilinum]
MPPIPPIPIHANDPINASHDAASSASTSFTTAAKADGITPRTANPPPTRTAPASVPATTTADPSAPPPPQPGARPLPPTATARETGYNTAHPAPPQPLPGINVPRSVEATVTSTATYQQMPTPAAFGYPAPTGSQSRGTDTTSTREQRAGPTTLSMGPAGSAYQHEDQQQPQQTRASLEHPPGYVQDPYASADGSAAQRRSLEDAKAREAEEGGVGSAVWGALGRAGEALKGAEEAVWRSVGRKG